MSSSGWFSQNSPSTTFTVTYATFLAYNVVQAKRKGVFNVPGVKKAPFFTGIAIGALLPAYAIDTIVRWVK